MSGCGSVSAAAHGGVVARGEPRHVGARDAAVALEPNASERRPPDASRARPDVHLAAQPRGDDLVGEQVPEAAKSAASSGIGNDADEEVRERQAEREPVHDRAEERGAGAPDRIAAAGQASRSRRADPRRTGWRVRRRRSRGSRRRRRRSDPRRPAQRHVRAILQGRARAPDPIQSLRPVTFFRQIALLLPSAFLLGVLLFLLTHGRGDAGLRRLSAVESWGGGASGLDSGAAVPDAGGAPVPAALRPGAPARARRVRGGTGSARPARGRTAVGLRTLVRGALFVALSRWRRRRSCSSAIARPRGRRPARCSRRSSWRSPRSRRGAVALLPAAAPRGARGRAAEGGRRMTLARPADRRPRLRLPVHAVDRPADSRGAGLLGRPSGHRAGRGDRALEARPASSSRAARRACTRGTRRFRRRILAGSGFRRSASATACSGWPTPGAAR